MQVAFYSEINRGNDGVCGSVVAHARSTACRPTCQFVWAGGGRVRSLQPHAGWCRSSWPAALDLKQRCSISPRSSAAFAFFSLPVVARPAILIVFIATFYSNSYALLQLVTSVTHYGGLTVNIASCQKKRILVYQNVTLHKWPHSTHEAFWDICGYTNKNDWSID